MRSGRLLLILVVLACAAAPGAASADPTASIAKACADVGPKNADTGLYRVQAFGLTCHRARNILNRWYHDASQPDAGPVGWRCRTYRQSSQYEYRTFCKRGNNKISYSQFTA